MRVLFVVDTWALIGGTERYAAVVVPALGERGHAVTVLGRGGDGAGMPPVERVLLPALGEPRLSAAEQAELHAHVAAAAPDVVLVSALRNVDALAALVDARPVVRYVHDHTPFCPGLNKVYETGGTCRHAQGFACLARYWLDGGCTSYKRAMHSSPVEPWEVLRGKLREMRVTRRAARVLTSSRYMRDQLVLAGADPERTAVLPYFTGSGSPEQPAGAPPPAVVERLERAAAPLVLTPARLTLPDKGVDHLLTALGRVRAPFVAAICGDGPALGPLVEKAAADGLADRAVFTGWQDTPAIEALYERADVVVCPSVWDEPFGLVGIEAMAHGKPVVAFDVGGIPDWLDDGRNGFRVPRLDVDAMASAIERLLGDADLRARMGAVGRAMVAERFRRGRHLDGLADALAAAAG